MKQSHKLSKNIGDRLNIDTLGMMATALRGIGIRTDMVRGRETINCEEEHLLRLSRNVVKGLYSHILSTMSHVGHPYDEADVPKYNELLANYMQYYEHFFKLDAHDYEI